MTIDSNRTHLYEDLDMKSSLVARFIEYLEAGAGEAKAPALAAALRADNYQLEAELLVRSGWTDGVAAPGVWSKRRTFVGRRPPPDAAIGELWLDVVEVTPMVLVEEPARGTARPPRRVWMSIRPVARWQFRAFAAAAPLVPREVQVAPQLVPLDPGRLDGEDAAVMTDVTFGESCLYAWWFDKILASTSQWQGAERSLSAGELAALWAPGVHEWGGYGNDEDERLRISAASWREDPDEHASADEDDELIVGAYDHRRDTGLRTVARIELHHSDGDLGNLPTMEPIALASMFPR
jgi:hypothetical protein